MSVDYSSTPLAKKLGIKAEHRVALVGAPDGASRKLEPLPEGAQVLNRVQGTLDVVLLFVTKPSELTKRFAKLAERLHDAGGLWVVWPKKASKIESDLSFELVQEVGLESGLVDNKSCSFDDQWQGLRFVYRIKDRAGRGKR